MIIACPSCGARFNLDPAKLLPAGRNVRCAKCDHRWRQMPSDFPGSIDDGAAQPAPAESFAPPPPEPAPEPGPQAATESVPEPAMAAAPAEEAEPHPPSPPETPAEMAQSLAAIAEQVAGAGRGEGYTVSEAASQSAANPIARLARRTQPGAMGPITVPPRMKPMRPAKRSSHLGLILTAGLIIGLLIAGYVFRDVIARSVPGADVVYSLFGFATDDPSADLDISVDDFELKPDQQGGQKVFYLWGTVFNKSEYPLDLPPLMVIPVDGAGSQMEPLLFRLAEPAIAPGQNIKFLKSFDNWPEAALNFEIKVADAE